MLVDRERGAWYIERSGEHGAWNAGERRGAVARDSSGKKLMVQNRSQCFLFEMEMFVNHPSSI